MTTLKQRLLDLIAADGPMSVARYMELCLYDPAHGYYATRPALGADGDFITAPETSQMFGELIGLWAAQSWCDLARPGPMALIEIGPGRGVLMADMLRAAKAEPAFRAALQVELIEPSAPLRQVQAEMLGAHDIAPTWRPALEEAHTPCVIIANEVLDCLPIRQWVRTETGWRERLIGADPAQAGRLRFGLAPGPAPPGFLPAALRAAPPGSVAETRPGLEAFVAALARRLRAAPGRALLIDYGAPETRCGDTFQAVARHRTADPLAEPGGADLTAHVDFAAVKALARAAGLEVAGPVPQGAFLEDLGLNQRASALMRARPDHAPIIARQRDRLAAPDQMGVLFQAICLSSPGLPYPQGFAARGG